MDYLMEKTILTPSMREVIECVTTTSAKNRKLLSIIPRRGPRAFEIFVDSLFLNDLNFMAEYLLLHVVEPQEDTIQASTPVNIQTETTHSDRNDVVTAQAENSTQVDHTECNICMNDTISVALNPCGHTLCSSCGDTFLQQRSCCFCKQRVTSLIRIYI